MMSRHLLAPFALGIALGLTLAGAPSCGPVSPTTTCSAATCAQGCCSAAGKCITSPSKASCGRGGTACSVCGTGQLCSDFKCVDPDAGNSGACGPTNCGGCCTARPAISVCINPPSATNCGSGGSDCNPCDAGLACVAGACKAIDGGSGTVGIACTVDGQCADLGAGHVCKKKTSTGGSEYASGYCTRACATDPDCPTKALCVGPQPGYGENDSVCWARCASATDCRTGYDCYSVGGGDSACWIAPLPPFDAGPPADRVGQPCGSDAVCRNPPDDGVCLTDKLSDGGVSAFTGGYCSAPCEDTSHCSADGGATCVSLGTFGACVQSCSGPMQGQSECRINYVCRPLRSGPDGGVLPLGFCWPSCKVAGCTTGVCMATGYCG